MTLGRGDGRESEFWLVWLMGFFFVPEFSEFRVVNYKPAQATPCSRFFWILVFVNARSFHGVIVSVTVLPSHGQSVGDPLNDDV